jgi:four helix bundle protein
MAFKFENLVVWQKALDFDDEINNLAKSFPKDEIYILTSQMKRAADSIVLNIAEGSTGQTNPEFKRFLSYATRSAVEVVACLHIAKKRTFINQDIFLEYYSKAEEIIKMLQGLRNSIK